MDIATNSLILETPIEGILLLIWTSLYKLRGPFAIERRYEQAEFGGIRLAAAGGRMQAHVVGSGDSSAPQSSRGGEVKARTQGGAVRTDKEKARGHGY